MQEIYQHIINRITIINEELNRKPSPNITLQNKLFAMRDELIIIAEKFFKANRDDFIKSSKIYNAEIK